MANFALLLVMVIVGMFFGLVAGIYAHKSNVQVFEQVMLERTKEDKDSGTEIYLGQFDFKATWVTLIIFGAGLGLLFAFAKIGSFESVAIWIYVAVFGLLTVLQIVNVEGKYRAASWNSLAVLNAGLLFFSIAGWMDERQMTAPKAGFLLFLIPIVAPFIAGAIRVATLDGRNDGKKEKREKLTDVEFKANLIAVVCIAAIAIGIGGLFAWIFS